MVDHMQDTPTVPVPGPPKRRRWPRIALMTAGAVVLAGAGYGVGAASNDQQATVNSLRGQLATAASQITTARSQLAAKQDQLNNALGQVGTAQAQAASAQAAAKSAQSRANAAAQAKYDSLMTKAQSALSAAKQQQASIAAEAGQLQSSQISADGVYVVGQDIKSGTWHTPGNGSSDPLDQCYYALLNSTNTSDIADNNNFNGPDTVNLSGTYAFEISGGCTWYRVSG